MHILQIYKDYHPVVGGIENHLRMLAEGLAARGHRVTVLTSGRGRRGEVRELGGVRVVYAGRAATLARAPLSPELPLRLRAERPDLVHLHMPDPSGNLAWALAAPRAPLVVTYHSDIIRQRRLLALYAPLLRATLGRAARIIATSPAYIAGSPFLAPRAARCAVVPLGVDQARFERADPAAVAAIRARYPGPISLFVGHLRYYKGLDQLVRAMAHAPGHALIVGAEATVRCADLLALARELGLAGRVHLLGEVGDLAPYYHAADLFVLPSVERSEAFGAVQIEAQAAGLPVVATELGTGTSYVTVHGETGLIVPPRDPAALGRAMAALIASPALARALGEAGRRRARAEFSLERMIDRTEAVYREVLP